MINLRNEKIMVTGGTGFLGRHIIAELKKKGCECIFSPRSNPYDFTNPERVKAAWEEFRATIVIHAAAKVGGILLNSMKPAQMLYDNLIMGVNLMHGTLIRGTHKFVQIGSACEYPRNAPTPLKEKDIWEGYPETTNAPYGVAKRTLLAMGWAYRQQYGSNIIHLVPTNLYGPGDNFDSETSHVIPALIKKFVDAVDNKLKTVTIWGSGKATREFIYVEDAAQAIVRATERYDSPEPLNIGSGEEIRIKDLALLISRLTGYGGKILFDSSRPSGQPRRKLDIRKMKKVLDFKPPTMLICGLQKTVDWYKANKCEK